MYEHAYVPSPRSRCATAGLEAPRKSSLNRSPPTRRGWPVASRAMMVKRAASRGVACHQAQG